MKSSKIRLEKCFSAGHLEAIAKVLGETSNGLTGSEIGHFLAHSRIPDVNPDMTKWKRLHNAFAAYQSQYQHGGHVIAFMHKALSPVRFADCPGKFDWIRNELNVVLAFCGYELGEDGKIRRSSAVRTLPEAEARASELEIKLRERDVHPDVLMFCRAELLQENYFHAVLEATKSVASKIRKMTDLTTDGARLAIEALSFGQDGRPIIAINPLVTDTDMSEQKGFMNLLIGLFGTFRNPTAHAEKIYWPLGKQDALDILSLVSLVHRKLDKAKRII